MYWRSAIMISNWITYMYFLIFMSVVVHLSLPRQLMMQIQSQEFLCLATLISISVNHRIKKCLRSKTKSYIAIIYYHALHQWLQRKALAMLETYSWGNLFFFHTSKVKDHKTCFMSCAHPVQGNEAAKKRLQESGLQYRISIHVYYTSEAEWTKDSKEDEKYI